MFQFFAIPTVNQLSLIQTVHEDEEILLNSPHAEWYRILKFFPWRDYQALGARYYNALYDFNKTSGVDENTINAPEETKEDAKQRLLFERPTHDKEAPVLFESTPTPIRYELVKPETIAPGVTPNYPAGKKPKCFFALFLAYLGTSIMGFPPEPEMVFHQLTSNLHFARVCGFIPQGEDKRYWHLHIPSLRKLQQFDQIMTEYGLWAEAKWDVVRKNLNDGVIDRENEMVGDTTHYHAFSGHENIKYEDENGKEKYKSQSKTTKNCRCEDHETCPHPWVLADEGAGMIYKSGNKKHWGHKASIIGLPSQGIPLDAVAVADAATNDGKTFLPHTTRLFENLPELNGQFDRALYDSACCDQNLKDQFMDQFGIDLKASFNPRRKKAVSEKDLPKGMETMTPYGSLLCKEGTEMDFIGIRYEDEKFIYQAPKSENGVPVCLACTQKDQCSPNSIKGRIVTVPFEILPHINPSDPPMAKRFKAIMSRRPSIERIIKRLKCDMGDDKLSKRGNASFQAYLDKTMIAFHILLRQ